jgi:CBS domain-containing protein
MTGVHFRHLPVVGDAGLAGIVDITDVCRTLLGPPAARYGDLPAVPLSDPQTSA